LPALLFFTDPVRTPDPAAVLARLPKGAGVVYRSFGAPNALATGRRLAAVARRRGLVLLIGADAGLARAVGADGVHLPERAAHRAPALSRRRPDWIVTDAAHGPSALRAKADAAVLSAVFPSHSPSAGRPLGPVRFAALVRQGRLPVYALGGVNTKNAPRLLGTGAVGIAAVEGLLRP
jgi:thiamine-phosphate pyrophosphorylase